MIPSRLPDSSSVLLVLHGLLLSSSLRLRTVLVWVLPPKMVVPSAHRLFSTSVRSPSATTGGGGGGATTAASVERSLSWEDAAWERREGGRPHHPSDGVSRKNGHTAVELLALSGGESAPEPPSVILSLSPDAIGCLSGGSDRASGWATPSFLSCFGVSSASASLCSSTQHRGAFREGVEEETWCRRGGGGTRPSST